jgi:uncharacterized membrane protein YdjX (TVP38/TMEM64 family)
MESWQRRMMKRYKKRIILLIFLVALILFVKFSGIDDYITFENLKRNRESLQEFVKNHYFLSVLSYIVIYISTALFMPGAIPLTIAGGFLFGVFFGTVYVCIGASIGATLAFFSARYLMGNWLQERYQSQLKKFNEEIAKNGYYYLLTLRIIPVFPFFLVNYLSGLTKVPLKIFLWTLFVTVLPGSVIYTFAGQQLGAVESIEDIYSAKILIAFLLLILFAFSPIVLKYMKDIKSKIKGRS